MIVGISHFSPHFDTIGQNSILVKQFGKDFYVANQQLNWILRQSNENLL